jgi:hypothetical protein
MRRSVPIRAPALLATSVLAILLAGCGPRLAWVKPNATALEIDQDIRECGQLAYREARTDLAFRRLHTDVYPDRFSGRAVTLGTGRLENDYFLRERQLEQFCLRSRGYELVPAPAEG